jgi:hypothetical protein
MFAAKDFFNTIRRKADIARFADFAAIVGVGRDQPKRRP